MDKMYINSLIFNFKGANPDLSNIYDQYLGGSKLLFLIILF